MKSAVVDSIRDLWQAVIMVKNRHMTYSDRQAEAARLKKLEALKQQPKKEPAEDADQVAPQTPQEPAEKH